MGTDEIKVFEMTQNRCTVLRFKVRQFEPEDEPATDLKGIGGKGRKMFAVPWAQTDAETGIESLNTFIEESIDLYIQAIVNKNSTITWNVFQTASGLASAAEPDHFIRDVQRLWTACRFIEGGWRCSGTETLGAERLGNALRPAWWVSPPPFIDYQFASLVMHRVLPPLKHKVLKSLEDLVLANKACNWFTIFLAVFILLHNCELIMAHEDNGDGHNYAWVSLQPEEREKAMVFMFGKLLRCIFEAQSSVNSVLFLGAEIFRETNPDHRFPEFRKTPKNVQEIIRQCTIGAPEWSGKKQCLVKVGNKLFPAGRSRENGQPLATPGETQDAARELWNEEIMNAEHYIANRLIESER